MQRYTVMCQPCLCITQVSWLTTGLMKLYCHFSQRQDVLPPSLFQNVHFVSSIVSHKCFHKIKSSSSQGNFLHKSSEVYFLELSKPLAQAWKTHAFSILVLAKLSTCIYNIFLSFETLYIDFQRRILFRR